MRRRPSMRPAGPASSASRRTPTATAALEQVKAAEAKVALTNQQKKELAETIVAVGDKVGLRDIDPVRSRKLLFQTVDDVTRIEKMKDPAGELRAHIGEVRSLKETLGQRWTPETML